MDPQSFKAVFVKHIIPVKGVDFYGFHVGYAPFLKIYFYNPSYITLAAQSLRKGAIMGEKFTVYEAHLSFPMQFMCDFALYGCNWLELGDVYVRGDMDDQLSDLASQNAWAASSYPKTARVTLQVDVCAHQILNRLVLSARNLHDKLTILEHGEPGDEPLISSIRELWEDERRRRAAMGLQPSPEIPSVLSQGSRGAGGDWLWEKRFLGQLRDRIASEPVLVDREPEPWAALLLTTFESIGVLWDKEHRMSAPRPPAAEQKDMPPPQAPDQLDDVQVDEAMILSQPFSEDIEAERLRNLRNYRDRIEEDEEQDYEEKEG